MKRADFSGVLKKIEELRAMMVFMHRTLPFLEDVFKFVAEIVPLLEVLKSSVESTSEKLPKASVQLNKVTTATEMASTEILNIVEGIANRTEHMRSSMDDRKKGVAELLTLLDALPENARTDPSFAALRDGVGRFGPTDEQYAELESIQNDCTNIMIALQVQDITAQQIASVNELMQSVDEGLTRLLQSFEKSSKHDAKKFKHQKLNIVFDSTAEFSGGAERQAMADALVQAAKTEPQTPKRSKKRAADE
jgi:chemotaxis regulatin CheY-phosphate phosphatase CheZ